MKKRIVLDAEILCKDVLYFELEINNTVTEFKKDDYDNKIDYYDIMQRNVDSITMIYSDGYIKHYKNRKLHYIKGEAICPSFFGKFYYINGNSLTREEWERSPEVVLYNRFRKLKELKII